MLFPYRFELEKNASLKLSLKDSGKKSFAVKRERESKLTHLHYLRGVTFKLLTYLQHISLTLQVT